MLTQTNAQKANEKNKIHVVYDISIFPCLNLLSLIIYLFAENRLNNWLNFYMEEGEEKILYK